MRRSRLAALTALAAMFAGEPATSAQTVLADTGDARLIVKEQMEGGVPFGFLPLLVTTENSGEAAVAWRLVVTNGLGSATGSATLVVQAPQGRRERVVLAPESCLAGVSPYAGRSAVHVHAEGPGAESWHIGGARPRDGVVRFASMPASASRLVRRVAGTSGDAPVVLVVDPTWRGVDWRFFSGVTLFVADLAAFEAAPEEYRRAARAWAATGGTVRLIADNRPTSRTPLGAGAIEVAGADLFGGDTASVMWTFAVQVSLANVAWDPAGGSDPINRDTFYLSARAAQPEHYLLQDFASSLEPVRMRPGVWIGCLIAFAVVIGPLNLFLLAPASRRHRLFWTTPLLALGTTVALVSVMLVGEGFGGTGKRRTLVSFVESEGLAVIDQEQVVRTAVLLGRAFTLAEDAAFALVAGDDDYRDVQRAGTVVSGDAFRSRSRQAHILRQVVPSRARVEVVATAADGAPIVVSTVPAVLRDFHGVDGAGVAWGADEVRPGERTTLQPAAARPPPLATAQRGLVQSVAAALVHNAEPRWWARASAVDGLAPVRTLAGIDWVTDEVHVTGRLAGGASVP